MNQLKPAFFIIKTYFRNRQSNLKIILNRVLETIKSDERNSISRIVYGTIRKELLLIYVIKDFSRRKLKDIDDDTSVLLKIGVFLLLFSHSYPAHAIVNEIINVSKKSSKPFLNAVLRKISENIDEIKLSLKKVNDPGIKHSISELLINNLKKVDNDIANSLEYLDSEPLFHLRINTKITDFYKAGKILESTGVEFRPIEKMDTFEIKKAGKIIRKLLSDNTFYFQNTGSQVVSQIAAEFARNRVLDCCAAPGTKSTTLNMIRPDVQIISADINPKRIRLFKEFSRSFQLSNISILAADILTPSLNNDFDLIILDAPCTSSGTIRKNPDLKLKITVNDIKKNTSLQKKMVSHLLNWSKPGTYILYSVCSFIEDETEEVIRNFFKNNSTKNPGISLRSVNINTILEKSGFRTHKGEYGTFLLPGQKMNNDLFYISLIQKT